MVSKQKLVCKQALYDYAGKCKMSVIATRYLDSFTNREHFVKQLIAELNGVSNLTQKIVDSRKFNDENQLLLIHKKVFLLEKEAVSNRDYYFHLCQDLYTRLNYFIAILTKCVETKGKSKTPGKLLPRGISMPRCQSLPSNCNKLYKALNALLEEVPEKSSNIVGQVDTTTSSKSVQTDNSDLQYCESCHLSTKLVKSLVQTVLQEQKKYDLKTTHVSEFREKLRSEILDMSQWGAMTGWVSAIQQDVKWATDKIYSIQRQRSALSQEREKLKRSFVNVESVLKNDLELITKQLQAEKSQCMYQKHQIEDLQNSLNRTIAQSKDYEKTIREQKKKYEHLQASIIKIKNWSVRLTKSHKQLDTIAKKQVSAVEKSFQYVQNQTIQLIQEAERSHKETIQQEKLQSMLLEKSIKESNCLINQSKLKTTKLESENCTLKDKLAQTEEEFDKITKANTDLTQKINSLENKIKDLKARARSNTSSGTTPNFNFSGDPVTDMESQRLLNKKQIRRLIKENDELKTTINKLKSKDIISQ